MCLTSVEKARRMTRFKRNCVRNVYGNYYATELRKRNASTVLIKMSVLHCMLFAPFHAKAFALSHVARRCKACRRRFLSEVSPSCWKLFHLPSTSTIRQIVRTLACFQRQTMLLYSRKRRARSEGRVPTMRPCQNTTQ
jgi:hypothetical protein